MNKKTIFATAALGLAAMTGANAADIPGMSRPYSAPALYNAYNWMGPYVGLNVGYQSGEVTNNPTEPSGGSFGIQGGYNWQNGWFVFGGEVDMQFSGADDVVAPWKFSNPWFGTARLRAGYAMNNILFYGTGGLAFGGLEVETTSGLSEDQAHFGWTAGVGAEVGLTPNWSAKVEYLYVDLSDRAYFIGTSNGLESSILRFGVNYRF
jgi:outer membrane immunogenic protein